MSPCSTSASHWPVIGHGIPPGTGRMLRVIPSKGCSHEPPAVHIPSCWGWCIHPEEGNWVEYQRIFTFSKSLLGPCCKLNSLLNESAVNQRKSSLSLYQMLMVLKSSPIPLFCICMPDCYVICSPGWDMYTQQISYVQSIAFISPFPKLSFLIETSWWEDSYLLAFPVVFPISAKV